MTFQMLGAIDIPMQYGKGHLDFCKIGEYKVMFVHFEAKEGRYSKQAKDEILEKLLYSLVLADKLGAGEVFSVVPKNKPLVRKFQETFGFEVETDHDEDHYLTRSTWYASSDIRSGLSSLNS